MFRGFLLAIFFIFIGFNFNSPAALAIGFIIFIFTGLIFLVNVSQRDNEIDNSYKYQFNKKEEKEVKKLAEKLNITQEQAKAIRAEQVQKEYNFIKEDSLTIKEDYNDHKGKAVHGIRRYSVYAITNIYNKRIYIGMTSDFYKRKSQHFSPQYRSKEKKMLYKYMYKLGDQAFSMIEIFSGLTKQEALYAEARLIKNWHTIFPYGYNIKEELDNRQLGLNVSIYNRDFFDKVKSIAHMQSKNKLLSEGKL